MKINFKTWQLALTLLLAFLIPSGLTIALAQDNKVETCKGSHSTRKEFYGSLRLLPPLTVTSVEDNTLFYNIIEKGIELGSLELEPNYSVVPNDFSPKKLGGCFGVTFCQTHKVVITLQELPPTACGK